MAGWLGPASTLRRTTSLLLETSRLIRAVERCTEREQLGMGGLIKVVRSRSPSENRVKFCRGLSQVSNVLPLLVNGPLTTIAINRRIIRPTGESRD